jgi:hypothetical protein
MSQQRPCQETHLPARALLMRGAEQVTEASMSGRPLNPSFAPQTVAARGDHPWQGRR